MGRKQSTNQPPQQQLQQPLPRALTQGEQALKEARERVEAADKALAKATSERIAALTAERAALSMIESEREYERTKSVLAAATDAHDGAQEKYRVVKGGSFGMNGQVINVAPGKVVTLQAYGRDGIERMLRRGIVLEPIQ